MADPVNYIPLGQGSETDALEALEEKSAPVRSVVRSGEDSVKAESEDEDDDKPKQSKQPHPKK